MQDKALTKAELLEAIIAAAAQLPDRLTRRKFKKHSGITERQVESHYNTWNEALIAAGLKPNTRNQRIEPTTLLEDWGNVVRRLREIPTAKRYKREGKHSTDVFRRKFGPWVEIPDQFREYAANKQEWADVLALLPVPSKSPSSSRLVESSANVDIPESTSGSRHPKLPDRPTYGNLIDFRGLLHEPVNEQGVVFLFGMVAKELGYMVEAVQGVYPDCEAKRQTGLRRWQRVRIEFEFESRNFRDHGHDSKRCDVIVCWRHNWNECPTNLEVVELSSVITQLSKGDD